MMPFALYVCNHYFLCTEICNVDNSEVKPRERGRVLILKSIIACSVECYSLVKIYKTSAVIHLLLYSGTVV